MYTNQTLKQPVLVVTFSEEYYLYCILRPSLAMSQLLHNRCTYDITDKLTN